MDQNRLNWTNSLFCITSVDILHYHFSIIVEGSSIFFFFFPKGQYISIHLNLRLMHFPIAKISRDVMRFTHEKINSPTNLALKDEY